MSTSRLSTSAGLESRNSTTASSTNDDGTCPALRPPDQERSGQSETARSRLPRLNLDPPMVRRQVGSEPSVSLRLSRGLVGAGDRLASLPGCSTFLGCAGVGDGQV